MTTTVPLQPPHHHAGPRRRRARVVRAPMPAGRAIATLFLTFVVASLLCSESLERIAQRQPYGTTRDIALAVTKPLHRVAHTFFLDRPRQWLADVTGNDRQPVANVLLPTATTATTVPAVTPTSQMATPTTAARRTPTPDAPLKVLMAGDSLIGNISQAVGLLVGDDPRVALKTDVQVGTGLSRPDVLDWGAELSYVLDKQDPDVVILSFGANDDQPLRDPSGAFLPLFSDGWAKEYARRVGAIVDLASDGGRRTVIWVGLAPERPDRLNQAKDTFNAAARDAAATRTDVHFVDLVPLFGVAGGGYTDTLTKPDGSVVVVRESDGVHLSHDGANLLAPTLWQSFAPEWHLA